MKRSHLGQHVPQLAALDVVLDLLALELQLRGNATGKVHKCVVQAATLQRIVAAMHLGIRLLQEAGPQLTLVAAGRKRDPAGMLIHGQEVVDADVVPGAVLVELQREASLCRVIVAYDEVQQQVLLACDGCQCAQEGMWADGPCRQARHTPRGKVQRARHPLPAKRAAGRCRQLLRVRVPAMNKHVGACHVHAIQENHFPLEKTMNRLGPLLLWTRHLCNASSAYTPVHVAYLRAACACMGTVQCKQCIHPVPRPYLGAVGACIGVRCGWTHREDARGGKALSVHSPSSPQFATTNVSSVCSDPLSKTRSLACIRFEHT
eukprot:366048-Chlamydomonas_euryale.AAC.1